jgi:hypothetical protein
MNAHESVATSCNRWAQPGIDVWRANSIEPLFLKFEKDILKMEKYIYIYIYIYRKTRWYP